VSLSPVRVGREGDYSRKSLAFQILRLLGRDGWGVSRPASAPGCKRHFGLASRAGRMTTRMEPCAVASCNELANFASHSVPSLVRKRGTQLAHAIGQPRCGRKRHRDEQDGWCRILGAHRRIGFGRGYGTAIRKVGNGIGRLLPWSPVSTLCLIAGIAKETKAAERGWKMKDKIIVRNLAFPLQHC